MSIRRLMATAAGGLMIAFAAGATSPLQAQNEINRDSKFIRDVASDNLLEIRLGSIAQKKATNPSVQQFGQRMVTDHTRMLDEWRALVPKTGYPFQPGLSNEQEQEVKRLDNASGAEFDRAYMTAMIQNHQNAVAKFQGEGQSANSPQVRDLVAAELPVLQQHLSLATQVGSQVGASNVAVTTPTPNAPVNNPTAQAPTQNPPVAVQNPPVAPQTTPVAKEDLKADGKFIHEFASDNQLEATLGDLALRKAESPAVRQYGQRMVTDHNKLQNEWMDMASRNGMWFSTRMGRLHREKIHRLEKLSGTAFDRAYMNLQIQNHKDYIDYFEKEGQALRSSQARGLVNSMLPTLKGHFNEAKRIGIQVGADTAVTLRSQRVAQTTPVAKEDLKADGKFIHEFASDNQLEATLGDLALRKAESPAVRQYGQRMVTDHNKLQNEWMDMASRNGMWFSTRMGRLHREKIHRLEKLSGTAFDRAYMNLQIQNHKDYIDYFEKEGQALRSSQARGLVNSMLPTLKGHFNEAKQIGVQVGADTAVTLRSQRTTANK